MHKCKNFNQKLFENSLFWTNVFHEVFVVIRHGCTSRYKLCFYCFFLLYSFHWRKIVTLCNGIFFQIAVDLHFLVETYFCLHHDRNVCYGGTLPRHLATRHRIPTRPELNPVSIAWSIWQFCYSSPWMGASPSQGYPQLYVAGNHFIHLDTKWQCRVKFLVLKETTRWQGPGLRPLTC